MDTTTLLDNLEIQLERLSILGDEIGYSAKEKQVKADEFVESVVTFIQKQVDKVQSDKEEILTAIESTHKSILSFKKLMGEFAANKAALNPSLCLIDNLNELNQEKKQVEARYKERLAHVKELYEQVEEFASVLGDFIQIDTQNQDDVSSLKVNAIEEEINRCEQEYTSRKNLIEEHIKEICNYFILLGIEPSRPTDCLIQQYYHEKLPENKMMLCNQLISNQNMQYITIRHKELQDEKMEVEFRKEEIISSLKQLWPKLSIKEDHCQQFLLENRGFTKFELDNYEKELNNLLQLKQERIEEFIVLARKELIQLWDTLYYSEQQRQQFTPAFTNDFNDTILEAHENEISRLELEKEETKFILDLIQKHEGLLNEILQFEQMTRDPNRLFSKGQRDPGRLLREEKFRKRITRELPKVKNELEGSLLQYEALKGHPFLVKGKPYLDTLYSGENSSTASSSATLIVPPVPLEKEKIINPPMTPKRETVKRKPMTSPRGMRSVRRIFSTPQPIRTKTVHLTATSIEKVIMEDNTPSILQRVHEKNMKKHKQKPIKRGHIFDEDSEEEDEEEEYDENTVPVTNIVKKRKRPLQEAEESDDNLDLGIFDDGPELSDMSDADA